MGTWMVGGGVEGMAACFCKNTGKYPPSHMVSHPRRTAFFTDISVS
jgi:hypothetical protein